METLEACKCDFGPQTVNPEGSLGPASLEQISTNVPVLTVRQLLNVFGPQDNLTWLDT